MKKLVLFSIISLMAISASAQTFTVNGVNYSRTKKVGDLYYCKVIKSPDATGDVTIPSMVSYNKHTISWNRLPTPLLD